MMSVVLHTRQMTEYLLNTADNPANKPNLATATTRNKIYYYNNNNEVGYIDFWAII